MEFKDYLKEEINKNYYTVNDIITSKEKVDELSKEKYITFSTKDGKYFTSDPDHILRFGPHKGRGIKENDFYYELGYSYWQDKDSKIGSTSTDYIFPIESDKQRAVENLNKLIQKYNLEGK